MVLIPAGTFMMGGDVESALRVCQEFQVDCQRSQFEDEEPVHEVYLDEFYIDMFEVTYEDYNWCIEAGLCDIPSCPDYLDPELAGNPVACVSWFKASDYCQWVGKRLPTEAEWEKAARGSLEEMQYPWGNGRPICDPGAQNGAQFSDCAGDAVQTGNFSPNGYGLYDMAGNVREWVADWYYSKYYIDSPIENTTGPSQRGYRSVRGGSFFSRPYHLRVSYRAAVTPETASLTIGFRCAYSP